MTIGGVEIRRVDTHVDERGDLTEIFRQEWDMTAQPVQWNLVRSGANVLRGAHVHLIHHDYLLVVEGNMFVGMRDAREQSPTFGLTAEIVLSAEQLQVLVIPPGVIHGFYFTHPASYVCGVSRYWDTADELGCLWSDLALEIHWPCQSPILSKRDREQPSLTQLTEALRRYSSSFVH